MRYDVIKGDMCPYYYVVDTTMDDLDVDRYVCECITQANADMIADALNDVEDEKEPMRLFYNLERVDPKTFVTYDIVNLTGRCSCGKPVAKQEAIPYPDPFNEDVHGDSTPVVMCDKCRQQRADDV